MAVNAQAESPEGAAAVIYLRVSSKEQAEKGGEAEGFSIPAQRDACKRKAASLSAAVIEEFADRGESAKTADRPELQRLLEFVTEQPVKYVIVHKVDRLARNRADDVAINLAIRQAGAELVSVSENIDQTPSGLLLHGIMSSIAEFYSRNLATEVIKGATQKAKNGGTPTRVPLGYLNVRRIEQGREIRTVEVDPERGPLMTWAFEAYASGDWTIRKLAGELAARGLTTTPGPKTPSKPVSETHLNRLLRNPYYMGLVQYQGVLYPGKHTPLVTPQTWQKVQETLTAKYLSGEKQREHPHYLKGSIYCGICDSRLIVNYAKGNGGTYRYFVCIGRQQDKTSCTLRAIRIELAEEAIAAHYAKVQLPEDEVARLRDYLNGELSKLRTDAEQQRANSERRLRQLADERKKLLDAHYADAIPLDLLKSEQARIAAEVAAIEGRRVAVEGDFKAAETNMRRALARVGDCETAYREASATMRRQFNLAFFKRLVIDDDYGVTAELAEPFDLILGDDLRLAAAIKAEEDARAVELAQGLPAIEVEAHNEQHPREPERVLVGAGSTPASKVGGCGLVNLVELGGLEPPTSWVRCARSARWFRVERCGLAAGLRTAYSTEVCADARGLSAIVMDSGTSGDKCLNGRSPRILVGMTEPQGDRRRSGEPYLGHALLGAQPRRVAPWQAARRALHRNHQARRQGSRSVAWRPGCCRRNRTASDTGARQLGGRVSKTGEGAAADVGLCALPRTYPDSGSYSSCR